ncbi:P-loop containing nucleoside triphosphate hydrolase protein [Dissophora ornata]|nr:P-loop containing nucleoside triphosphate hydrolase protein [Dissophora ornata]
MKRPVRPLDVTLPKNVGTLCEAVLGYAPDPVQLGVAVNIGEFKDCMFIAGGGRGKTLSYFLPLLLWSDRVIVVVVPLEALADPPHQKLNELNISSIALKSDIPITPETRKRMEDGYYRAIFVSAEMMLSAPLEDLWHVAVFRYRIQAVVIDEAHSIVSWSRRFRKDYEKIVLLRTWLPSWVPFLALSATLPWGKLAAVKKVFGFKPDVAVFNEGDDRPNVKLIARWLRYEASTFKDLDFVLDKTKKTIVYFDSRAKAESAHAYLMTKAADEEHTMMAVYLSYKSDELKNDVLDELKTDRAYLLISTKATGMRCDTSNIDRVVQYGCPWSLESLVQRFGRAARGKDSKGEGILLIPKSLDLSKLNTNISQYIITSECRRRVLNKLFDGGNRFVLKNCCDRCEPPTPTDLDIIAKTYPERSTEDKKAALEVIKKWRLERFQIRFKGMRSFSVQCLMPDDIMEKIAENLGKIESTQSIISLTKYVGSVKDLEELGNLLVEMNKQIDARISLQKCDPSTQGQTLVVERIPNPARDSGNTSSPKSPRKRPPSDDVDTAPAMVLPPRPQSPNTPPVSNTLQKKPQSQFRNVTADDFIGKRKRQNKE